MHPLQKPYIQLEIEQTYTLEEAARLAGCNESEIFQYMLDGELVLHYEKDNQGLPLPRKAAELFIEGAGIAVWTEHPSLYVDGGELTFSQEFGIRRDTVRLFASDLAVLCRLRGISPGGLLDESIELSQRDSSTASTTDKTEGRYSGRSTSPTGNSESSVKYENLLKTFGLMTRLYLNAAKSPQLGSPDDVNVNQLVERLMTEAQKLPEEDRRGLGKSSLSDRINQGLRHTSPEKGD